MRLTWRDAAATALVGVCVAFYAVSVRGGDLLVVSDTRGVTALVFLVGMAACVVGGDLSQIGDSDRMDLGIVVASVLGTVAFLAAVGAMLTGSALVLLVLVADIVALWAVATVRHLAPRRPAARPAAPPDRWSPTPDRPREAVRR
jgi:hypothetical protein